MLYPSLSFPTVQKRPFFYTNFVTTVDGKVQVNTPEQSSYWPIGSTRDYETLIQLRTYADVLVYGKSSALSFNHGNNLAKKEFQEARKQNGKDGNILYLIVCNTLSLGDLAVLKSPHSPYTKLIMPENAYVDKKIEESVEVLRLGKTTVDLRLLSQWLHTQGYKHILVEGGPTLLGSFLAKDLLDDIFLTIAPKIFGTMPGKTLTLVEGQLFSPEQIKKLQLLSLKQYENEVFLHYRITY